MIWSSSVPASAIRFSSWWRQSKASWFGLLAVSDFICLRNKNFFRFHEKREFTGIDPYCFLCCWSLAWAWEHLICYFNVRCCEIDALSLAVLLLNLKHSFVVVRAHSSWAEFQEYFRQQVYHFSYIFFSSSSPYVWCLTWHIFLSLV